MQRISGLDSTMAIANWQAASKMQQGRRIIGSLCSVHRSSSSVSFSANKIERVCTKLCYTVFPAYHMTYVSGVDGVIGSVKFLVAPP